MVALAALARVLHRHHHNLSSCHADASPPRAEEGSGEAMHDGLPTWGDDALPAGLGETIGDRPGGASSGWGESGWGGLAPVPARGSLIASHAWLLGHGLHAASTSDVSSTSTAGEHAGEARRAEAGEAYQRGIVVAADWAELRAQGEGAEVCPKPYAFFFFVTLKPRVE